MLMPTNEIIGSEPVTSNDTPAPNDIGFFSAIGTKWKQNAITDLGLNRSESTAYNDTIHELYPEMELNQVGHKGLNQSNYSLLNDMWDEGYFKVGEDGVIRGTDKYNQRGIIQNKYMPSDYNVAAVNNLRNKGFTPDKLHNQVVVKAKKTYMDNERDLRYYDSNNLPGQSGAVDVIANIGTWLSDPINAAGLGIEIGAFKSLSKGILKEGRDWLGQLSKSATKADFGAGTASQVIAMKFGVDRSVIKNIFSELNDGIISGKPIKIIQQEMLNKAKNGDFNDDVNKFIKSSNFKARVKEMGVVGGFSGVMGSLTEAIFQEETFDFKSQIVNYTEADKERDIALSGAFGLVFGSTFNLLSNLLGKTDSISQAMGDELSETTSKVIDELEVKKIVSDIEEDIPINGVEAYDDITPINFEKEGDEAINSTVNDNDLLESLDPETSRDLEFKLGESEQWDKVKACMTQYE